MKISESVTVTCQAICMQKFGLSVALFQIKTLSYIHHFMLLFICSICQTIKHCHLLYLQRSWKRKSFVKEMQLQEGRISFYKEMLLVAKAESFLVFCLFSHFIICHVSLCTWVWIQCGYDCLCVSSYWFVLQLIKLLLDWELVVVKWLRPPCVLLFCLHLLGYRAVPASSNSREFQQISITSWHFAVSVHVVLDVATVYRL